MTDIRVEGGNRDTGTADRALSINATLAQAYPQARCALDHSNPLELLVATVLSAQSTDARVNTVTPELFSRFPTAAAYADAAVEDIEEIIRPTGLHRSKAKNILALGACLVEDHDGAVPASMTELVALPGVGRKTALVVLGNAFGIPGFAVDTHVARVCRRLGLTSAGTPLGVERDVTALIDAAEWTSFSHRLIFHGREVCRARRPGCGVCVVADRCSTAMAGVAG